MEKDNRMKPGIVKWFDPSKGYGFISPEDDSKDIFVHMKEVEKSGLQRLSEGQKVSFNVVNSGKSFGAQIQVKNTPSWQHL